MKKYKNLVWLLKNECDIFLQQVEEIGNECAMTDSTLENILETAATIRKEYKKDGISDKNK